MGPRTLLLSALLIGCAADAAPPPAPRWHVPELRVCAPDELLAPAQSAIDAWAGLGPEMVLDCHEARVQVGYGPTINNAGQTLAHSDRGVMLAALVTLEATTFEGVAAPAYDATAVLTHEFGHVLGLGEIEVRGATMWPWIAPGDASARDLAPTDIDAILALYPESAAR
jgi:hypothetical protein